MNNTHTKALSYAGALFLVILSVLAVGATLFVFKGQQSYGENTITVTGTGEVSGEPDVATFSFTVTETADEPEAAQETISKKVDAILSGLDSLNIDKKDISTNSYSINPRYEWVKEATSEKVSPDGIVYYPNNGKQVLVGYDVSQSVNVKLRDLDKAGEALALFAQEGVENLYGPNFEIDDPEGLQEEARLAAVADAKEKAKRLAKDLDVRLGKIVSYNEGENGYYPMPMYAMAKAESVAYDTADSYEPSLPVGTSDITSTVNITYQIK